MTKMYPHDSSVTTNHGYDDKTEELHLTFKSGETHAYRVSKEFYDRYLQADSKGKFFNQNLRSHPFRRVR